MFRFRRLIPLILAAFAPSTLLAVTLTMGNEIATPNSSDGNIGVVRTTIDLVRPANHTGNVTSAKVYWSSSGCANAFKIKFFRRVGDTLTMTAERGPFTPTANQYTATLTPAVAVQQGDLIGVTRLVACGNAGSLVAFPSEGFLQFAGDVSGSVAISAAANRGAGVLALSATGTATETMARVIPVVGSTAGGFGAQFRTEVQFFNPYSTAAICKVVFHRAGTAGSTGDTTRLVNLAAGEVFSTADVVAAMGETGLGSLDISVPAGGSIPIILARVYNDEGAEGTSGLTEVPIETADTIGIGKEYLARGVTGFLVTPRDPAKTRFNIGVRTFYSGAVITARLKNSAGVTIATVTKTYTANYFTQVSAESFLGTPIAGDQTIEISVSSGSAVVYGSTTDNTTNDPAIQFVRGVFAIA